MVLRIVSGTGGDERELKRGESVVFVVVFLELYRMVLRTTIILSIT